jgi:hypothetical protein
VLGTDSPLLDGYLNSANPGIGVYDDLIHDFSSTTTTGINSLFAPASIEQSIRAANTLSPSKMLITSSPDLLAGLQNINPSHKYPTSAHIA